MRTSVHSPGKPVPNLIVMLTYHDVTVSNAAEVFELCKDTRAQYWGIKEEGLPLEEMQALFRRMKDCGKITCLEVVAYTEAEGLRGAEIAAACGCDLLMGTVFSDPIHAFCQAPQPTLSALCGAGHWPSLCSARHRRGYDRASQSLLFQRGQRH